MAPRKYWAAGIAQAHGGVSVRAGPNRGQREENKTKRGAFSEKNTPPPNHQKALNFHLRRANYRTRRDVRRARVTHEISNGDLETLGPCRYTRPKGTELLPRDRGWWVLYRYTAGVVIGAQRHFNGAKCQPNWR